MKIMLLAAATLSLGVGAADADNKDNAREKLPIWGSVPRTVSARELKSRGGHQAASARG